MAVTTPKTGASSPNASFIFERIMRVLVGSQEAILFLCLAGLIYYVGNESDNFLSTRNMVGIFSANAYIAIAAIGMSMVIISGNIDISVGSLVGVLATISGEIVTYQHFPDWVSVDVAIWLSWLVPLVMGALVGGVIGAFVTYLRIPSIVVTLAFLSILKGGLIYITNGERITDMPEGYELAQMKPFETTSFPFYEAFFQALPMPVILMFILTILAALWMRYSPTGRAIYAVGGNKEAARLSGISEHRMIMTVFMINGIFVGISSVLYATQLSVIQSTVPPNLELTIITSSVVGGVSILGGTGTVIGAMLAAILLSAITKSLVFLDISPFWTRAIQGVMILVTVLLDLLRRRRQAV